MPDTTLPRTPAGTIRVGYHGSTEVTSHIVAMAGHDTTTLLRQYDIADPFRELRAGEFDLIVVKFGLDEPDLVTSKPLAHDARAVVMSASHPLAHRESVSIEELADHDAFDRPGEMPAYVWDEVVPAHTPSGRPIHRRHRVTTVPDMMRLVAGGDAVHISLISLADIAPPGIRVVPIHDLPAAPVSLAWLHTAEQPPAVRDFISTAEAAATP
ncbi:substrate-binding domain-containing protein [Streptomyces sp. NPDC050485]|uniref:substrate-binding domain-containing protein n=1 Tax=Streptomyces sp. NPDC050485 TaxID=3365617 RepID=UPI00378B3320